MYILSIGSQKLLNFLQLLCFPIHIDIINNVYSYRKYIYAIDRHFTTKVDKTRLLLEARSSITHYQSQIWKNEQNVGRWDSF